ncbi:hypothetical protein DSL72_000573 [Monilinia vaccinii-corymbosi]|uniref:Uncharacterized protein n=1 Tax=Monilinia vaccinii-corymbosi TaxID=61207 RepID=A0A8A3P1X9_9HELO|nr:hypothetical protein DSL72_000573 [Monilinia vaccinii-corymbosi]
MSESEYCPALLQAEEPSFQCNADAQDFSYQSIRAILQRRVVEDISPPRRAAAWLKSSEEISEITSEVANHPYFQRLGRPDYTQNGKSRIPFTAINPLNDGPLDRMTDAFSLYHNPFPVDLTNLSGTAHMRGGGDDFESGSPTSYDKTVKPTKQDGENMIRSDSGYGSVVGETFQEFQPVKPAEKSFSAEREELETAMRRANRGARECEGKAWYYNKQAVEMLGQARRIELQIMALDDQEEDGFDAEERVMQAMLEKLVELDDTSIEAIHS